MHYDTNSKSSQ